MSEQGNLFPDKNTKETTTIRIDKSLKARINFIRKTRGWTFSECIEAGLKLLIKEIEK